MWKKGEGEKAVLTGPKIAKILPEGAHPVIASKIILVSPFFDVTSNEMLSKHKETGKILCHVLSSPTTCRDCVFHFHIIWGCRGERREKGEGGEGGDLYQAFLSEQKRLWGSALLHVGS